MKKRLKRSFIREILEHTSSDTISFAGGLPDEGLFPTEALQASAYRALAEPKSLQYSTSTGYTPLKERIAQIYSAKGFGTTSDNIIITSGSQQALDIICRYYAGETMSIESPSYLGAMNLFTLNNINTKSIPLYSDGVDLDAFESSLATSRLAYLIPDFQNPTGASYSHEHREQIASLCQKHHTLLIEDAPYSELYFDNQMTSIASMLPHQSFHLGSFSKVLAPALRIGWIRADTDLLAPLIAYKEAMDLHTSSITQSIVADYLHEPKVFELHKATLREKYKAKMLYFAQMLELNLPQFTYTQPKGGMFIYGKLEGVDTMKLVRLAIKQGVVFVPGSEFGGASDAIRFNYTHSTFEEIEEGLKRIALTLIRYLAIRS